jgi:hypothetical protein
MQDITDVNREEWTPKQSENWEKHGKPIYDELSEKARKWYVRTYRPKKRGDGMMQRDDVKLGTPEHYFVKTVEGIKNPMSSIQGEIMATFGISDEDKQEIDDVASEYVDVTTSDAEKANMAKGAKRLSGILGK